MTAEEAKKRLPPVPVWHDGHIVQGYPCGRLLPAARVYYADGRCAEWSWAAIGRAADRLDLLIPKTWERRPQGALH